MNKKAQIFSIYLVILTLFMCTLAIFMYLNQQEDVINSLASPVSLLKLQDEKEIFEMQEELLIKISAQEVKNFLKWDSDSFILKFKEIFFEKLNNETFKDMKEFLTKEIITVDGTEISPITINFEGIYDISFENEKLKIYRRKFGKQIRLKAPLENKINFVVDVEHFYEKTYLISKEDIE